MQSGAQNRLPWTRLSYSTAGDVAYKLSSHLEQTHAMMNRMEASRRETKYLCLILTSVPGSGLIWNAVD